MTHRLWWRGRYNEDTDLCLQALSSGSCTVLLNAFLAWKMTTMQMRGGNTDELYRGDGRLRMAKALERMWPGVVTVTRRFRRPQHSVRWGKFTTQLKPRPGARFQDEPDEMGMDLKLVRETDCDRTKALHQRWVRERGGCAAS